MTRTDQVTILTQHLARDIFISNSLQITEFAFRTFVKSGSTKKSARAGFQALKRRK